MKKTDRQLRGLIRQNPAEIRPERKETLLLYLTQRRAQEETSVINCKSNRNLRRILVLTALAVILTTMISAAAVIGYYRTPGGDIVDKDGNPPADTAQIASGSNDQILSGPGYRIPRITWSTVDGRTSLAVWADPASEVLSGLRAVTDDGKEYPLTKTTFNLNSSYIGYTNDTFAEPQSFTLVCTSPVFSERVVFLTSDVIEVHSVSGGITLFGSAVENTVFYGVNDTVFPTMKLSETANLAFARLDDPIVKDTAGNICGGGRGGSRASKEKLTTYSVFDLPAGVEIASIYAKKLGVILNFTDSGAVMDGRAPHVYIPVPNDGETLRGSWVLLDSDGFRFVINSVSRSGWTLTFTSAEGLTYSGTHDAEIEAGMPGSHLYTGILGRGMMLGGGDSHSWTMQFRENEWDEYQNEKGWIPVCVCEIAYNYTGEWTLEF
ncbi:MAG: hypothetical protein E7662_04890 [Ruminococcaceae bacterium]|nr:hypothetical protein [Oscillospiraceae bacterium]